MDAPITDVVVVTNASDCPHEYTVLKETPCGHSANIWEKVFGGRAGERYICFTKTRGQNDSVIEDMIIPPPSQKYLRRGYRAVTETPDGEEPIRHKQLVLKRSKRSECTEAVVDIVVYRSKDEPAHNFRKLAKVNDLYICIRSAKIPPLPTTSSSTVTPSVQNIVPVQEKVPVDVQQVQADLQPVVEAGPDMDTMLKKMDQMRTFDQSATTTARQANSSTYSGQGSNPQYPTTAYSQTGASYAVPQSTGPTYSNSQTAPYSSNTHGMTTSPESTYSGSVSYSNPSAPYASSDTSYSNPNAAAYNTNSYSNTSGQYSDSTTPYSYSHSGRRDTYSHSGTSQYNTSGQSPSAQYPGSSTSSGQYSDSTTPYSYSHSSRRDTYPYSGTSQYNTSGQSPSALYPGSSTSSGQYSAPYSSSYSGSSSYSNPSAPYASAGYSSSNASYSGSGLPYSANPTANPVATYSNPQYPGYSTQPPPNSYPTQQYPSAYQSGTYPPTTQGYGGYPTTGGSYGGNQSTYPPPTTKKHFGGDIGF